jgi:hypothetical protein
MSWQRTRLRVPCAVVTTRTVVADRCGLVRKWRAQGKVGAIRALRIHRYAWELTGAVAPSLALPFHFGREQRFECFE